MSKGIICCVPRTDAVRFAADYLKDLGLPVSCKPSIDASHLLLPVPSFPQGDTYLASILSDLPEDITVSGGNLSSPLLRGYRCVDFLQDPYYLADNAAITADCAVKILKDRTGSTLSGKRALVLGWGRIGKCLGKQLEQNGVSVTIAARKDSDLAMIHALGYHCLPIYDIGHDVLPYDAIINTVPEMVLPRLRCSESTLALELASKPGMGGDNIISARGLPGKMAPEISGKLIAKTFIRLSLERKDAV